MFQTSKVSPIFMLVQSILLILCSEESEGITSACKPNRPCSIALASHNDITLTCHNIPENANISWQYLNLSEANGRPETFITANGPVKGLQPSILLKMKAKIENGQLILHNPAVENTGTYTCKDGEILLAYYEIDFQDAQNLFISYAAQKEKVQKVTTLNLGDLGNVVMFTVWSKWQPCDRCRDPGEQKRVGFCYAKVIKERKMTTKSTPCGILKSQYKQIKVLHRLELRIKVCNVSCAELNRTLSKGHDPIDFLLLDTYYAQLHGPAILTCPFASIYRTVYWEKDNHTFTHLEFRRERGSRSLDPATGGGSLSINFLNETDTGTYKCYVNSKMTGKFHVQLPQNQSRSYNEEENDKSAVAAFTAIESLIIGFSAFLAFAILLVILHACRRTRRD